MDIHFLLPSFCLALLHRPGRLFVPHGRTGSGPAGPESGRGGGGGSQMVVESLQQQLRDTAEALKLTPRQAVLWTPTRTPWPPSWPTSSSWNPCRPGARMRRGRSKPGWRWCATGLTAMEDLAQRAEMLYQSLDEQQKKVADQRLSATVPALYSGLACQGGGNRERGGPERSGMGPGGRGGMGGGGMGQHGRRHGPLLRVAGPGLGPSPVFPAGGLNGKPAAFPLPLPSMGEHHT